MNVVKCGDEVVSVTIEPSDRLEQIAAYSHLTVGELIDAIKEIIKEEAPICTKSDCLLRKKKRDKMERKGM